MEINSQKAAISFSLTIYNIWQGITFSENLSYAKGPLKKIKQSNHLRKKEESLKKHFLTLLEEAKN